MTSVEKRRSGRKSGGHRRHSDGGYSDTSSGGSFLDENDREVSSLTDRAFRSLCIGDEAVYNDSDLSLSSPCTQKDRQLAFSQSGQDRDREYREREELKRAAHENFSLKVQQYGQDWIHGRRYGGEIHRDPRWEVSGERAQGRISATFQHSVVETSQQEKSLREELNFLSNGATELSSQQRRSRSRVSSLIRAFNSEGHRDGVEMEDKLREWSEETSWDKSALMSIQRELSEFSTSYQQNFHSGHFPSSGPFSYRDTNLYSSGSDIAAASHSSASSFMRSSQSMFTQVDCNSHVFIHSEFSPFKVWRDHNRFPFQQGQVSGFMHCSEFPKWYETPMYKEPSQMGQPQGYYTGIRQPRSNLAPMISPALPRSTSTSTMLQNASAVEKRCESELAGHYPHRKRTQSLGTNRLPSHRPSTASPTTEMSRRVRDTISSVKALQQKIKMMTEQNITTGVIDQQAVLCSNENLNLGNNAITVAPNIVSSNTSTTPFNISQMLTPLVHAHPEAVSSDFQHYAVSPQPVEHPPVRAESRGATPDVRMSTYKSRATSLLFNLKDNRKRVKSTYSPTKFKAVETPEKNKQEPRETAIDIPYFPDSEIQFSQLEESSRTSAAINQYRCPELPLTVSNSQPVMTTTGQYTAYSLSDYQTAQMQGQMVHHSGFTGFLPENYIGNKLVNGQNLHEDLASFAPYKQDMMADAGTLGRDLYTHNPPYSATETPKLNADNNQSGGYLISKPNTEQPFNETVGRLFTKVEKCEQLKHNKHDYNNVSLQDKRRQINSQDTEKLGVKATLSPWKQETAALMEKTGQENQQNIDQEFEKEGVRESFAICPSDKKPGLVNTNISNQPFSNDDNEKTEMKDTYFKQNYNKHNDNEYISHQTFSSIKEKHFDINETTKQYMQIPRGHEVHDLQPTEAKPQSEHNIHKNSFNPDNTSAPQMSKHIKDRQFVEVKSEPVIAEHIKSHHTQVEVAKVQQWAQVEQPEAESSRLILAGQSDSEKVTAEQAQAKAEHIKGEKIKGEQTRQFREKQPELAREEETKAEQTRLHEARDEPRNITEKAGAEHIKKEQGKQVKAEQAEAEKLKEEHIKTKLAKTEQAWQARIEEAKTEQATEKRINAAQIQEAQVTTEQVKKEQTEVEQSETEKVNAKQAGAEKTNTEQVQEQQTKEKVRTNTAEVEKVQTDHIKIENFQKAKEGKASAHVGRVNTDRSTAEISTMQDAKPKERKVEWAKQERAKAELIKAESMQEMSAKLTAKLTATQQVKIEPDKVEQVKTELAKAKAELAKIKEKMRGEQKEKVKHSVITKEDDTAKNNVPLKLNIHKNEDYLKQDKTVQMHQQKEDSVIRNGADDYERLREKYGFTNLILANRNNASATEDISLNDANETQVLSPDKAEIVKEKSTEEHSPTSRFTAANKEKIEEVGGFKSSEVSESQCVHSDSSKEFKLSNANYSPTSVNKRINGDTVRDKMKDNSVGKLEKCDPVKVTEVSQQRDSDLAKLLPHERKSKSAEHTVGPVKDQHFIPPRSLSHKERTMTKQEILTSKIKAHAEKEISAIKEKGCAIRDGFTSKSSSKQLAGSQTVNTRQRPPSQEASKKHESSVPSNIKPKPQMEPSGVQVDLVKSVSPTNSKLNLQIPVKSSAITTHNIMSTAECLLQNQKQETKPMKNKEQPPTNDQGEQKADHTEISGKPKDGLKDYSAINTDNPNKKEEDPGHTAGVEATNSKPVTTGNTESKEADRVDLSPLLNVVFGQKKDPTADQSLQIKGIMVTVRERKPTVNTGQGNCSTQNQMNAIEKENNSSDLDKHPPNSGLELSERNISTNELTKTKNIEETEDQAKFIIKSHSENVQETPPSEAVTNNMRMCQKRTHPQQESSTMNIKPQGETQPETLTEKGDRVTVSAKNKVPGETQPLLYKENIIARERKDHTDETLSENSANSLRTDEEKVAQNEQTAHTNENFSVTAVNTGIDNTNDAETLIKQVTQQTVKEDMTNVVNHSNISSVDGIRTTVLEENKHDSTTAKTLNTSPSNKATKNEKTNVPHKRQDNEKQISDTNKEDDNLHIDNIAIQVVPPVTEDSLKKVGKQHGATLPYDAVQSNEEKQVASSSCKEKVKTLNNEEQASTKKYSSEDTFGVQHVLSSVRKLSDSLKISSQQNSNNATSENMQSENEELEKVKKCGESNEQPAEGDYFQVQGITETSNEPQHNSITDRDASKGRELPGLPPNKTAVSNESHTEGKIEAFVFTLDQSKRKTVDSSTLRIQDEDAKRKAEAEDKLASKQRDGFRERWSSNENTEADQDNHIGKQMEKQSTLSATERQSSRNSRPARESTVQEKPEVKPKPKGKVSTIPEISAIADYARLKVIVSEDREETAFQEYPPNKKEGFFPLIQTRHSRRPVFTPDPQELSVKEKSLPNKTELSAKVNKVPKAVVFPITDKEHQRTGMFKLGEKERQDAKVNEDPVVNATKYTHHKERNDSPKTQTVQMSDSQRVCQEDQNICQPNSHSLQAATSASVVKNSLLHSTMGQMHNSKENMTQQMQDERVEKQQDKDTEANTEDGRTDKLKEESLATQHDKIKVKQQGRKKQGGEEQALMCEEEKKEDMRIKHILEESRASMAEEEMRAIQREEERRAREREAIAIKIKERRDKQRESERRADEERKVKQKEEDIRAKQREEKMRMKETEEKTNIEEQHRAAQEEQQKRAVEEEQQKRAAQEEQHRRAAQEEKQRRTAQEEQQRAVQEEQHRRAAQEELQRKVAQEELRRRAVREEQQRRAVQEEQQRRAAEEQWRKAAQEELQRRAAQEEQQRRVAQEEQQRRAVQEEQQRRAAEEQWKKAAQEEQQRRATQEEQQRRAVQEEQQRRAVEEQRKKAAQEEQQRRAVQEEQQRRAVQEEQQRRVAQEEQQRRAVQEEQQRRAAEEQRKKAAQEEQQRRATQEEQQRRAVQEEQQRRAVEEQRKKAAQEELQRRAAQEEQQRRAVQEEQQRRAVQEEQQRRVAQEEQQRTAVQEEQQRRAAEEQLKKAAQEEQQRRAAEEQQKKAAQEELQKRAAEEQRKKAAQEEQQRRATQEEQQRRAAEEQWKKAAQEELQRRAAEEQQKKAAQEELQKRAAEKELQRRAVQEEQQRRAAQEEQQRKAAQEEQQRKATQEVLQRRAAQEVQHRATQEHQRRAAQEEQQRKAAQEEQPRKATQEELQRRAAQGELQRRAAQEEQPRKAAQEVLQRRAAQEVQHRATQEHQRRAAQEEQQRKAAQEEQPRKATQEELQRRAAQGELQRRAAQEEQPRKAAQEELQRRAAQEEQWRTAAQEEQRRRAAQEEQQKKAVHEEQHKLVKEEEQRKAEEQQRRAAQREVQMRVVQEIQQRRRAALIEEQRETEKILVNIEEEKNRKHREEDKVTHISEKERINQIQIEEKKRQKWKNEEWIAQKGEAGKRVVEKEKIMKEQNQVKERPKPLENSQEALKEEKRVAKDDDIQANKRKEEKLTVDSENVRDAEVEQKRAAQVDALQYYAITSTESEKKPRERQLCSPSPSQQRNNLSEHESPESHMRPSRPHAPASPASSLPRSNTSSPALGAKPLMFRVKDNTFRGSSSTKSVKPRFFKSFGDDFRMGSPSDRGSDRREEEQEKIRHSGGTPVHLDTGLNRLIAESSTFQSASSPQDHSTPIPHYRPYSRRSIAMDEDDSRSFISNMSADVESFATGAADLAETRGLYDYERPESACSFSSDASRSLGKPPVVPPKSEKALRRAQRLTTRRMKKELSKVATDSPTGVEKDVSTIRSPSSTEVRSPSRHAMASPHFSSPISLANAPVLGSSLPSSHTEHQSSHYSFHASPHATGPISIPHSTAAVSLPAVSPYATGPASHAAAPKTVAHVPSSPTLHHPNHPAPVTQYHVESSYPQSYPLTQRKVLQDPGSGQYFVVDLPVQVKKKTFFDPQTGKYIQLNVRESGQSILQPQPQQTCPQPQLQPQMQIKPQQQPFSQTLPAGKPVLLYQGYHGYPQGYQPANINSLHPSRSQVPAALHQNQQPGYPGFELGQNSEGHRYSPEKTPYMDTVNDKAKTSNTVYSTHGSYESFPECDTNSQLARSSVCENDNSAHSQCRPRDIIAMSELEDFMEVSDW